MITIKVECNKLEWYNNRTEWYNYVYNTILCRHHGPSVEWFDGRREWLYGNICNGKNYIIDDKMQFQWVSKEEWVEIVTGRIMAKESSYEQHYKKVGPQDANIIVKPPVVDFSRAARYENFIDRMDERLLRLQAKKQEAFECQDAYRYNLYNNLIGKGVYYIATANYYKRII